ncbi:MAG TPA: helix-turn-helix domain-containing protein [Candidatus Ozemobacteraceae bacterium]|nr:helix-turn-helix domain-containing protein [Candidatus Ozemobacteraceae bacterium]
MDKLFSMAEVCRITGLAAHTIRFYETQFPRALAAERTPGGHRKYRQAHIEALNRIVGLSRNEGKSLRDVREILGEDQVSPVLVPPPARPEKPTASARMPEPQESDLVQETLSLVLQNLEKLNARNERLDKLVSMLVAETGARETGSLLSQIDSLRHDTRLAIADSRRSLAELGMRDLIGGIDEFGSHEH